VTGALSSTTGANFATSSGSVGIGTASPAVKLHVQSGSAGATALRLTDAVRATLNVDFPATSQVRFDVGAAEKMLFSSGGSTILTVNDINSGGGLAVTGTITMPNSAQIRNIDASGGRLWLGDGSSSTNAGLRILSNNTTNVQVDGYTSAGVGKPIQFDPNGSGVSTGGALAVGGALSKASGSFRIEHPLPSKSATHQLVHSFIEGPKADLIYRGKVALVNGKASVNIDAAATMTEGTFEVLCRDVQCFTTNETGWTAVRGKVSGNILTIEAKDADCADDISWMVIGERKDQHMMETDWTDDNGRVIVEPLKPVAAPEAN